jgi:hypothetical protein
MEQLELTLLPPAKDLKELDDAIAALDAQIAPLTAQRADLVRLRKARVAAAASAGARAAARLARDRRIVSDAIRLNAQHNFEGNGLLWRLAAAHNLSTKQVSRRLRAAGLRVGRWGLLSEPNNRKELGAPPET